MISILAITPVFRDWEQVSVLCRELDIAAGQMPDTEIHVLMVDDGSPDGMRGWRSFEPKYLRSMRTLFLRRNLGHQKAIATALCHAYEHMAWDAVLVLDADGEDRPEDAIPLIRRFREDPSKVVFAERRRRMEDRIFKTGYHMYRYLHLLLTGVAVRVGNFSVLSRAAVRRLVVMPELWNHYVGAVFRSKLAFDRVPINRGTRYGGKSQMNLISLVTHGLSGIATFQDVAATRILLVACAGMAATVCGLVAVAGVRMLTDRAIPGWATSTTGLLLILLSQLLTMSFSLTFILMANRTNALFLPERDCRVFVDRVETIWAGNE